MIENIKYKQRAEGREQIDLRLGTRDFFTKY